MRLLRALLLLLVAAAPARADRLALWNIVHGQCVAHAEAGAAPAPCVSVRLDAGEAAGSAVLKDMVGDTQFLLIPTARVTGIEDAALRAPDGPNYFADAWRAIDLVGARAGVPLPREDLSLAVNSTTARSQDQLHIHLDCVRADVKEALAGMAGAIGPAWAPLPEPLLGRRWRVLRIDGEALAADPFRLLAAAVPAGEMGAHTLVVVGMVFPGGVPGFVLLDGQTDLPAGDFGSGEDLQDHACALARR